MAIYGRAALGGGVLAGPVFVVLYTVEGKRRADYDPLRHPVSSLSVGPRGWVQRANFTVLGALYLGLARDLRRRSLDGVEGLIPPLVAAAAVGLFVSAAAETDPVSGYPPGSAARPVTPSRHGIVHDLGAIPVFLGIPVASLLSAARAYRLGNHRWAAWSTAAGGSALIALGLSAGAFDQRPSLVRHGGLFQRAAIVSCLGWLTTFSARMLRRSTRPS